MKFLELIWEKDLVSGHMDDRERLSPERYWCGHPSVEMIDGYIYYYTCEKSAGKLQELQNIYGSIEDIEETVEQIDDNDNSNNASLKGRGFCNTNIVVLLVSNVPYHMSPAELSEFILQHDNQLHYSPSKTAVDLIKVLRSPSTSSYFCLLFCYASSALALFQSVCSKAYNPLESQCCHIHLVQYITAEFSSNKQYLSPGSSPHVVDSEVHHHIGLNHYLKQKSSNDLNEDNRPLTFFEHHGGAHFASYQDNTTKKVNNLLNSQLEISQMRKENFFKISNSMEELHKTKHGEVALNCKTSSEVDAFFKKISLSVGRDQKDFNEARFQNEFDKDISLDSSSVSHEKFNVLERESSFSESHTKCVRSTYGQFHHGNSIHYAYDFIDEYDFVRVFTPSLPCRSVSLPDKVLQHPDELYNPTHAFPRSGKGDRVKPNEELSLYSATVPRLCESRSNFDISESYHSVTESVTGVYIEKTSPFALIDRYECPAYCGVCLEKVVWSLPLAHSKNSKVFDKSSLSIPFYDCVIQISEGVRLKDMPVNVLCGHTFHGECLLKWYGAQCPYCRYQQYPFKTPSCDICGRSEGVKMCLICGFLGCDNTDYIDLRSTQNINRFLEDHNGALFQHPNKCHAYQHFIDFQHVYAIEIESNHVWDFSQKSYVHRLLQTRTDGKLVEIIPVSSSVEKHNPCESEDLEKRPQLEQKREKLIQEPSLLHQADHQENSAQSLITQFNFYSAQQFDKLQDFFVEKIKHLHSQYEELNKDVVQRYESLLQEFNHLEQTVEKHRHQNSLEKKKHASLVSEHCLLQKQYDSLVSLNKELEKKIIESDIALQDTQSAMEAQIECDRKRLSELEQQIMDLEFHIRAQKELVSSGSIQPTSFVVGHRKASQPLKRSGKSCRR